MRFWQPFNDWWRAELDKLGRRPDAQEIVNWWAACMHAGCAANMVPNVRLLYFMPTPLPLVLSNLHV